MKTANQKVTEFITKEIHRLEKKVADIYEKYPESDWGCKAYGMTEPYKEQIEELVPMLKGYTRYEALENRLNDVERKYSRTKASIIGYCEKNLPSWDVERIKGIIEAIENSRNDVDTLL